MKKVILSVLLMVLLFDFISAFPQNMSLNIQTTDSSGNIQANQQFTFNFSFDRDRDCTTPSGVDYSNQQLLRVDIRGITNITLPNVDLNFSEIDYILCYRRDGTLKSQLQVNPSPYARYAQNVSGKGILDDSNITLPKSNISASHFFGNGSKIHSLDIPNHTAILLSSNNIWSGSNTYDGIVDFNNDITFDGSADFRNTAFMAYNSFAIRNPAATQIYSITGGAITGSKILYLPIFSSEEDTFATFGLINGTIDGVINGSYYKRFWYNQTGSFNYNQTQSPFFYNQTLSPFFYNMTINSIYDYNQSTFMHGQNATFTGNISASTGFFVNLGSWLSRITRIFAVHIDAQDINATNINTTTINNFFDADCPTGNYSLGIQSNGTVKCANDQIGGSGATINIFNQDLNTTNNVTFANLNLTNGSFTQIVGEISGGIRTYAGNGFSPNWGFHNMTNVMFQIGLPLWAGHYITGAQYGDIVFRLFSGNYIFGINETDKLIYSEGRKNMTIVNNLSVGGVIFGNGSKLTDLAPTYNQTTSPYFYNQSQTIFYYNQTTFMYSQNATFIGNISADFFFFNGGNLRGNVTPIPSVAQELGSASNKFRYIYVSGAKIDNLYDIEGISIGIQNDLIDGAFGGNTKQIGQASFPFKHVFAKSGFSDGTIYVNVSQMVTTNQSEIITANKTSIANISASYYFGNGSKLHSLDVPNIYNHTQIIIQSDNYINKTSNQTHTGELNFTSDNQIPINTLRTGEVGTPTLWQTFSVKGSAPFAGIGLYAGIPAIQSLNNNDLCFANDDITARGCFYNSGLTAIVGNEIDFYTSTIRLNISNNYVGIENAPLNVSVNATIPHMYVNSTITLATNYTNNNGKMIKINQQFNATLNAGNDLANIKVILNPYNSYTPQIRKYFGFIGTKSPDISIALSADFNVPIGYNYSIHAVTAGTGVISINEMVITNE